MYRHKVVFDDGLHVYYMSEDMLTVHELHVLSQAKRIELNFGFYHGGVTYSDVEVPFPDKWLLSSSCLGLFRIPFPRGIRKEL